MKIKEYLERIDYSNPEYKYKMNDILEMLMCNVKNTDKNLYNHVKWEIIGMAYNYKFDKGLAEYVVNKMKPRGEYWSLETTNAVKNQNGISCDEYEFYITLNGMANDYGNDIPLDQVELYTKLAKGFIDDIDAKPHKVWNYVTNIMDL